MANRISKQINSPKQASELISDAIEHPAETAEAALGQAKRVAARLENFVTGRPAMALGVAIAAGIALGWWVKRK